MARTIKSIQPKSSMIVSKAIKIKKADVRKKAMVGLFLSKKNNNNKNAADKSDNVAINHL
jgi:hypothetical protein